MAILLKPTANDTSQQDFHHLKVALRVIVCVLYKIPGNYHIRSISTLLCTKCTLWPSQVLLSSILLK